MPIACRSVMVGKSACPDWRMGRLKKQEEQILSLAQDIDGAGNK